MDIPKQFLMVANSFSSRHHILNMSVVPLRQGKLCESLCNLEQTLTKKQHSEAVRKPSQTIGAQREATVMLCSQFD